MLRIIGGILVLLGATGIGYGKTRRYYLRLSQMGEICRGMELIRCEMNYTLYSVPKLLSMVSNQLKEPVATYFRNLGESISQGTPRHKAHREALEQTKGLLLPADGLMALIDWSMTLGQFDPEGENRMMKLSIRRMEQALNTYTNEKKDMAKSYTLLSVSAGIALIILML